MSNDFTEMAKRIEKLPQSIEQNVDEELGDEMGDTATAARREVNENGSVAFGELLSSIHHKDDADIDDSGYATHVTRASAPYAAFVEYGTGIRQGPASPNSGAQFPSPSAPPVEAIREWMIEKPVEPREYDTVYGAAAAIAEDIADWGTKAHPFMRPAWHANRQSFSVAHARGVRQALRRL